MKCLNPKCFNYEIAANCKVCIRGYKFDLCKTPKNHSPLYSKSRKCDAFLYQKIICQCVLKKYCATCTLRKKKYENCEKLPSKYIIQSKLSINNNFYNTYKFLDCCAQQLLAVQPDF